MAGLFDKSTDNVLDSINADDRFSDHFDGDLFNGAESNFLGIAIGKKARARKAAKRNDRQAARKYKLETERIRALQGQPKQNLIKDIGDGVGNLAKAVVPFLVPGAGAAGALGGMGGEQEQPYDETYPDPGNYGSNTQNYRPNGGNPPVAKSNTMLYVIIGVAVLLGAFMLMRK